MRAMRFNRMLDPFAARPYLGDASIGMSSRPTECSGRQSNTMSTQRFIFAFLPRQSSLSSRPRGPAIQCVPGASPGPPAFRRRRCFALGLVPTQSYPAAGGLQIDQVQSARGLPASGQHERLERELLKQHAAEFLSQDRLQAHGEPLLLLSGRLDVEVALTNQPQPILEDGQLIVGRDVHGCRVVARSRGIAFDVDHDVVAVPSPKLKVTGGFANFMVQSASFSSGGFLILELIRQHVRLVPILFVFFACEHFSGEQAGGVIIDDRIVDLHGQSRGSRKLWRLAGSA